jgi:biopolymer transport protein ExbB/TolQ
MLELIKSGEPFLFANMFLAAFGLGLIIQRIYSLWFKYGMSTDALLKQVMGFAESGSYARALQLCNARPHPLTVVFKAALLRANRSEREIRRAVEMAAVQELPKLRRGTGYLPQMSNVATLLGLIGTIRGLIISFGGVGGMDAGLKQEALSKGISIAFYNTFFGLVVAVAIIAAYMFVLGRQNKLLSQMEFGAAQLVDQLLITQQAQKTAA